MPFRTWSLGVPLLGSTLWLAACGAGGPPGGAAAPSASGPGVSAGRALGVQRRPRTPASSADQPTSVAAARKEAAALLRLLPAYPGARLVAQATYVPAASGAPLPAQMPAPLGLFPQVGVPGSDNLVDAYATWVVPAPPTAVLAWARQRAAAAGLVQQASGGSSGPGFKAQGLAFVRQTGSLTPGIQVSVQAAGQGKSVVRYDAMVIWLPPRPAAEDLPSGVTRVQVDLLSGTPQEAVASATVTATGEVDQLVALVNGLPTAAPGVSDCPAERGQEVRLTFVGPGKTSVTVSQGSCGFVRFGARGRYPSLTDPGDALWKTAATLAGRPGWTG